MRQSGANFMCKICRKEKTTWDQEAQQFPVCWKCAKQIREIANGPQ